MLTAAAVVVVLAGGALVVQGILSDSGSNESSDATELQADTERLDVAAEAPAEEAAEELDAAQDAELALESPEPRIDDIVSIDSPDTLAELASQILADEALLIVDENSATASADEPTAERTADDGAGETELGATDAITAEDFTCGLVDRIIGEAEFVDDQVPQPVAIGVDIDETEAVAYRVDTCEVLARTRLGS